MARRKKSTKAKRTTAEKAANETGNRPIESVTGASSQAPASLSNDDSPETASSATHEQAARVETSDVGGDGSELAQLVIPLDRLQAFVRFVWRGAIGAACIWLGRLIWAGPASQTIVYLSFLICAFSIALTGLMLVLAALRWLALALWPSPTQIIMTEKAISLRTGAFGHDSFTWSDIRVELEGDLEADIYESLPAEALVPTLRHQPTDHNVFGSLQTYCGRPAEELAAQIKPFVLQRLRQQEATAE